MTKNIIIILLILIAGYFGYKKYISNEQLQTIPQTDIAFYNGPKFSFNYPKKYTLTETNDEVSVTSTPIEKVDKSKCQQLADEEARALCLNPTNKLSPNIKIKLLMGDPNVLWKNTIIGDQEETITINSQVYKLNYVTSEFGGRGAYGLFLNNKLLLATYTFGDSEGGYQFDHMKSPEYQLDQRQQKELLEQILKTLNIK